MVLVIIAATSSGVMFSLALLGSVISTETRVDYDYGPVSYIFIVFCISS